MARMFDLFAGRLGWAIPFLERGWHVTAIDLMRPPNLEELLVKYGERLRFVVANIIGVNYSPCIGQFEVYGAEKEKNPHSGGYDALGNFDFICASSPCEQFSVHGMKHFHPNPPYPELGIKLFEHTRALCEKSGVPYVMENVRAAQNFVGKAVHHCGPFYLWGSGVPAIVPQGIQKGINQGSSAKIKATQNREQKIAMRKAIPGIWHGAGSAVRIEQTGRAATIPSELSNTVASYAERLLEKKAFGETDQEQARE